MNINTDKYLYQDFNDFKVWRFGNLIKQGGSPADGYIFPLSNFKYLTFLCDGYINPNSNYYPRNLILPFGLTSPNLYFEYPDGKRILCDGEIRNLSIYQEARIPTSQCEARKHNKHDFIKGFHIPYAVVLIPPFDQLFHSYTNYIYTILSVEPINYKLNKMLQQTEYNISMPANSTNIYFLGEINRTVPEQAQISYIPHCPKAIRLLATSNPALALFSIIISEYTDNDNAVASYNSGIVHELFTEQVIHSTRLRLFISNNTPLPITLNLHVEFDPMNNEI
jgi:hypothetical protein